MIAKEEAESHHEVSRLVRGRDLLVKKAWVFFGGRRVVSAERARQNLEVIRLSEKFNKHLIVLSSHARSVLGMTNTEKLQRPHWIRRLYLRLFMPKEANKALRAFGKLYQRNVG